MTLFKLKRDALFFCHCAISDGHKFFTVCGVQCIYYLPANSVHKRCTCKVGKLFVFTKTEEFTSLLMISWRIASLTHTLPAEPDTCGA